MTMNVPIGFVLLVNPYNPPAQAGRLIRTLNGMFNHPPITCHHDFGKHPQFIEPCPPNVRLVRPHVNTKWGDFSCVAATVQALRLLYAGDYRPEWFVFLSGADYPIKPAGQILEELRTGGFDGYIEHRLFSEGDLAYPPDPDHRAGWKGETWLQQCHRRYCSRRVDVPSLNRYLKFRRRTYWLEHPFFTRGRLPFTPAFKGYAGEAWFSANHRCARRILDFWDTDQKVKEHYRQVLVPEESYLHTVLANDPELKLSQNCLRYVDWNTRQSNPKVLTQTDLPRLKSSAAHFARKFDPVTGGPVLDEIDRWLGVGR